MSETLDYFKAFVSLPLRLRRHLAQPPLTLERAQRLVRERMAHRDERFLALVERSVYGWPRSPYLTLLRQAGCEFGDLRALVQREGLDDALRRLRAAGVYVTFEEFKGRKPIRRAGQEMAVSPRDFDNPFVRSDFAVPTGGSTGAAVYVGLNLEHLAEMAQYEVIDLAAEGQLGAPTIVWRGILPDFTPAALFRRAAMRDMPRWWFSPIGWRDARQWPKYAFATLYIWLCMRAHGLSVPWPKIVRVDQAAVVAQQVAQTLQANGRCMLSTTMSRAVRVCLAAEQEGLDLRGAAMRAGGEPATPAKLAVLARAGVRYRSGYAISEAGGHLALGCRQPLDGSDLHLLRDAFALITYPHSVEGFDLEVPAFHVTTLMPTAPKLMLNAQLDDYGIVEERACGCPLDAHGYTTHLRQIRSYSKLTGEGVTLAGSEIVRLLEDTLPAKFGGGPQDYQLAEEEDQQGLTRLYLLVSPRVPIASEEEVVAFLLAALRRSSPAADAAGALWQSTQTVRIRRAEPIWTDRGKLQPLHILRRREES